MRLDKIKVVPVIKLKLKKIHGLERVYKQSNIFVLLRENKQYHSLLYVSSLTFVE